nr:hypothetical protein [Tanacetum cinerariifolium]
MEYFDLWDSYMIKSLKLPKSGNQLRFFIQQVPSRRTSNALSIPRRVITNALYRSGLIRSFWLKASATTFTFLGCCLKRNKHFPEKIASNLKFLNNLQPEWSLHVTIVHQPKDLHTADYTQLYDFLKYNQKEVDELKAERLAKIQDPLVLMANSNNPYFFPAPHLDQPSYNQNYMQQPMPSPEDITDPTTAMNMALTLMAKAFKLNYSTPTNNNQRISSNPRNRQIAQPGNLNGYNTVQNVRNQVAQNPRVQNVGNQNGLIGVPRNANLNGNDLDEIEEVNANCILMANLQQASTWVLSLTKLPCMTQTDQL